MSFRVSEELQYGNYQGMKTARVNSETKSINAGDTNISSIAMNPIDAKRNSARKQAMKLIKDAWARDEKASTGIKAMKDEKSANIAERNELNKIISDIECNKEKLREEYGIEADSKEQKDLELLEKYQNNKMGAAFDSFSEEEKERLKELSHTTLTEYQKKALELNGVRAAIDKEVQEKGYEIVAMTESITDSKINQLKSQDMLKSQDGAEALLEAAEKDICGMLIEEGKSNIDEAMEEQQEAAEKAQEKKEEQQEQIDEAKKKKEEQKKIIEGDLAVEELEKNISIKIHEEDNLSVVQKDIEKLLKNNSMINEDLLGIEIDLNF